jgi:hypothetical protein
VQPLEKGLAPNAGFLIWTGSRRRFLSFGPAPSEVFPLEGPQARTLFLQFVFFYQLFHAAFSQGGAALRGDPGDCRVATCDILECVAQRIRSSIVGSSRSRGRGDLAWALAGRVLQSNILLAHDYVTLISTFAVTGLIERARRVDKSRVRTFQFIDYFQR